MGNMSILNYNPEDFVKARSILQPLPDTFYASMLPFKRDLKTGERGLAVPSILRDALLGSLDLAEGVATGQMTPQATAALPMFMTGGLISGAPKGALMSGVKRLPSSEKLNLPQNPTKKLMDKFSYVENVPLSNARAGQNKMDWKSFNSGKYGEPMIKGYESEPVAIKLKNGEYIMVDGHHRTVSAINSGKESLKMRVIDAEKYDPQNSGVTPKKTNKEETDLLLKELGY